MMLAGRRLLGLLLLLVPLWAAAETVYVIDVIRIGVRPDQQSNSKPLDVVPSGTPLEVIEKDRRFYKVQTPEGKIGWVADSWLTTEVPPRQQLAALQEKYDKLLADTQEIREQAGEFESQHQQMSARMAELALAAEEQGKDRAELVSRAEEATRREQMLLAGWGISLVLAILFSYLAGRSAYRKYVESRLGGLQI